VVLQHIFTFNELNSFSYCLFLSLSCWNSSVSCEKLARVLGLMLTFHITSHHIASHHFTSHHIASHHPTSHHVTHHTTLRHITSYLHDAFSYSKKLQFELIFFSPFWWVNRFFLGSSVAKCDVNRCEHCFDCGWCRDWWVRLDFRNLGGQKPRSEQKVRSQITDLM
jgi:hypothetical protein